MNSALSSSRALKASTIVRVFNELFLPTHSTCLVGAAAEPLYEPGQGETPARISFREDFASSALHEIAHWCIAGAARRRQIDYGYWYDPDGRSIEAQARFLRAEARPQALEWCFSQASGLRFRLSMDNLDAPADAVTAQAFATKVLHEARSFYKQGLPSRAALMFEALAAASGSGLTLSGLQFLDTDLL
ncbi:MAG: elongation factor P hydroxylase [Congregibacter sp.]|nr:elongation factor P hydroxylase [Congregibacter sp.]MDP5071022.1 elongation factor P hydroxylase [Congregibacter sp.]